MDQTTHKEKHSVHCQGCYFWGEYQVLGYGRLKKKAQGNDTLNKKQILPCQRWCRGPLLFLNLFIHFVLILLFHNSGKLSIPHDHPFLRLQIMYLVLFKSLHCQGALIISRRADLSFFWNDFLIYFWPSVSKSCPPRAEKMQRGVRRYWWQVKTLCL